MKNLDRIVSRLEVELDAKDGVREAALKESREITRLASAAMREMLRGASAAKPLREARARVRRMRVLLRRHPELWHAGPVETALQEVSEAAIVDAILRNRALPVPQSLGVTSAAYVLGLADAIGELRRFALDHLRVGNIAEATRFVEAMDDIFHAIMRFHYPDAIVAVRHKQDVARSLIERTRGELAVAARSAELERMLARLTRKS